MARNYHGAGFATIGTDKSAIGVLPTAAIRPKIFEIIIGSAATPAAQAALWVFQTFSADGTGTTWTPIKLDPADPASLVTNLVNYSVEPTYTANSILWRMALNQQATFDFKTNAGKELVLAASATAGGGIKTTQSTGTAIHFVSAFWEE
jgi:hypothetical protein